jgi:uncharacterized damage-inducible protein DinB
MTTTIETTATLSSLVRQYASYNFWANSTLINWLRMKPLSQLEEYVPSSFPSLRETLIHIWDTERFWLAVAQEKELPVSFRKEGFEGTTDEVFDGLLETSEAFLNFVNGLEEDQFSRHVELDTPWVSGTKSRFEFIHHCMNHSTYHRGQVITIGRVLGYKDAPMTDYNFYVFYAQE